jgi:hypothetical protein
MRHRRGVASGVTALLLLAGITGCEKSDFTLSGPTATSTPDAAAEATRQELSNSVASGISSARTTSITFLQTGGGASQSWEGDCRLSARAADGPAVSADVTGVVPGLGEVRIVLLPGASYVRMPESYGLPRGKPWLKITIEARDSDDALTTSLRPSLAAMRGLVDPRFGLAMLDSAVTVKAVGKDHLDIVDTTKYLATIDVARNADAEGAAGEAARDLLHQGVKTLKAYLWVTSSGLPHQLSVVTPLPKGAVTRVFTYQQWGKIVVIKAPPLSHIATPGLVRG